MSFWSKLGKVALKAAPIAAGFIPGVGPLASMAIGGLAAGADKKLSGGSWKDSLLSGGIGAGTGYLSGKLGDMTTSKPGIGPSNPGKFINSEIGGVSDRLGKLGGGGALEHLGVAAKTAGKMGLGKKILGSAIGAAPLLGMLGTKGGDGKSEGGGNVPGVYGWNGESFGDFNYRNPDLGAALNRGKMRARGLAPSGY